MRIIADLHIHSPYARAVSRDMTLENLDHWARLKGITVMGTGDFTHPKWIREIKEKLELVEPGLYVLKSETRNPKPETISKFPAYAKASAGRQIPNSKTRFMLTAEVSSIYSKGGKVRRIHNLIFAPSIEAAEKINTQLGWVGNLASDGRPILGLDAKELVKIVLTADPTAMVVPAHAWTPWFSLFGSMSGFDSIRECFEELTPYIPAIETGLSSDPGMNWRLSQLDQHQIVSFSDAHSPRPNRIGREVTAFEVKTLSYANIEQALRKPTENNRIAFTIEFFPEEGKYHYDGHRLCQVSYDPQTTKAKNGLCERCGRSVTIGVMNQVEKLADRPAGYRPEGRPPYRSMVPLAEIIGDVLGVGAWTKGVEAEYLKLVANLKNEFHVLLDASGEEIAYHSSPEMAEAIGRVREGKVSITPGYDGEYGKIKIFDTDGARPAVMTKQASLF